MQKVRMAIFEDDPDLFDLFKELLPSEAFEVEGITHLAQVDWTRLDILVGDYKNVLVPFSTLIRISRDKSLPLIAISGGSMDDYPYQLMKPFAIEELEALVYNLLSNQIKKVS